MQGKICESVHKTVSINLICMLCKVVNRVSSAIKNYLQHFTVTSKCNSCIVKLQLYANAK